MEKMMSGYARRIVWWGACFVVISFSWLILAFLPFFLATQSFLCTQSALEMDESIWSANLDSKTGMSIREVAQKNGVSPAIFPFFQKVVTAQLFFLLCAVIEPFSLRSRCACILRTCYVRCWLVATFLFFPLNCVMRKRAPCIPFKTIFQALSHQPLLLRFW